MKTQLHGDTRWFTQARFGMFIHWGLYAMASRGEWVRNHEKITTEDYQKYFDWFDPDLFQPQLWAKAARNAGMKYVVITTKHHEGFCLWDTAFTDYKSTNTLAKRDLLREIVDAFRAEGLHIGLYYSLLDWHHEDFTIDCEHPQRDLPPAEIERINRSRDMKKYALYMRNQVTELLTNYGKIDILWFDYSYPDRGKGEAEWEGQKMVDLVRSLAPDIIMNDRLHMPGVGDIVTPEQFAPDEPRLGADGHEMVCEGCNTFSGSWGYHRDESSWKSTRMCLELLVQLVAADSNLLMNVGPTSRGYLDFRAMNRLEGIGEWMRYNARSIYGCGRAPKEFTAPPNTLYTYNAQTHRLYLHCLVWPFRHVHLRGLAGKVRYAQLLADGSEIAIRPEKAHNGDPNSASFTPADAITLEPLPMQPTMPGTEIPVIELILI